MRTIRTYCSLAFILVLTVPPASIHAQVAEEDSLALVAIYNATDGLNWINNNNWLTGKVKDWSGVFLKGNAVHKIFIPLNNLTGELPDFPAQTSTDGPLGLTGLTFFDLQFNHLTGDVPILSGLWSLETLNLNNNELSGPVPASIGSNTLLTHLDLSNNQLSGDIPPELASLINLEVLRLNGNAGLTGTLPLAFTNISGLRVLDLTGTGICIPDDPSFLNWLAAVDDVGLSGCTTPTVIENRVSTCSRSQGGGELNTNNVTARLVNTGGLFYNGEPHVYNVPNNTGGNAIFASAIWIAGMMNGQLRASATRYGEWEFWAGPIDDQGEGPADCAVYDRIYSVSLDDVKAYESSGRVTADLKDWPTGLGAPTVDADGHPIDLMALPLAERKDRVINLAVGERPQITGTQTIWWVMNDRGNKHESTRALPMGLEAHVTTFAASSQIDAINNSTFYTYRLFNRNSSALTDIYVGLFLDVDLGDFADDYIGSDSTLGLGYVYNSDNEDVGGPEAYGTPPPALGVMFLRGPHVDNDGIDNDRDGTIDEVGERLTTTSVITYFGGGGSIVGDPQVALHYYNYMQARWKNGEPRTLGGFQGFRASEIPAMFTFPGDPVTGQFWSELNIDAMGTPSSPGDRKFVVSSGPFSIGPGEETDFTIAIVWAKGKNNLDSVTQLKRAAAGIQDAFSEGFEDILYRTPPAPSSAPPPRFDLTLDKNFPDPFSEKTSIHYTVPQAVHVRIIVFNALGRQVRKLVDEEQSAGEYTATMDGAGLPSGVYYYRVEVNQAIATGTMVLVK